jgi:hypothetical protein
MEKDYKKIKHNYRKCVKNLLDNHGNEKIVKIVIRKSGLGNLLTNLLNITSNGHFQKLYNEFNNDNTIKHAYMICKTDSGIVFTLEKMDGIIEVLIDPKWNKYFDDEYKNDEDTFFIDQKGNQPTVMELFENTRKYMGDKKFFYFSCYNNNCLTFVESIIISNNMSNEESLKFIDENISKIYDNLPLHVKSTSIKTYKLTDKMCKIYNRAMIIKELFTD